MKLLLLSALLASTCETGPFPKPPPEPEPPSPWEQSADAAPPEEDAAAPHTPCYLACANLRRLGCVESQPTPGGATCTQVCSNNENGPEGTQMPVICVQLAKSCEAARKCK